MANRPWTIRLTLLLTLTGLLLLPPVEADARQSKGFGKLEISSITEGAQVQVDGKEVGTLPLKRPLRLSVGKHTIKVTKRGYTEYLDVFSIKARDTTVLDVDLLPFAGIFSITCNEPQARVFVDGKFVGNAPIETEVLIGLRKVKVRKPGFYNFFQEVDSVAGKSLDIEVALKAMPVGTTPYRPPPPPPPKWYEKWYVWAGAAGGVAAITAAIVIPVILTSGDPIEDFNPDYYHKQ